MKFRRRTLLLRAADGAFLVFAGVAIGAVYHAASAYAPVTALVSIATATSLTMHARFVLGRQGQLVVTAAGAMTLIAQGAALWLTVNVLSTAFIGAEQAARCNRRSCVLRAATWTAAIAGVTAPVLRLASADPTLAAVVASSVGAVGGALLAASVVIVAGPLLERTFGHVTPLTLNEWLSYDHPLLQELLRRAPGTFHHSVNVGVLAHAAANAVGADPLLARVGGLYHDVGKIEAPEFFAENQDGVNPHDVLEPDESARLLRAHVVDGVRLVSDHHMGSRIADVVFEHHGTSEMRFFKAKADARHHEGTLDSASYRYPGPPPRSFETAIVMIADQVEATARATAPAGPSACQSVVRQTITRIREEGQLELSGLDSRDLARIEDALTRAVQAMHHERPQYPAAITKPRRRFTLIRPFGRRAHS